MIRLWPVFLVFKQRGDRPTEKVAEAVKDYDPELDVVFLGWQVDDEIIIWLQMKSPRQRLVITFSLFCPSAYNEFCASELLE